LAENRTNLDSAIERAAAVFAFEWFSVILHQVVFAAQKKKALRTMQEKEKGDHLMFLHTRWLPEI
jgi:hypothetical protein